MNTKKLTFAIPCNEREYTEKKKRPALLILFTLLLSAMFEFAPAQYSPQPPDQKPPDVVPPSGYVVFNFGLSQPEASFAKMANNSYSGYALPGNNFGLSFGIPIAHSNLGIAVAYNYSANPYDIDTYVNNIQVSDQSTTYYPVAQDAYRNNTFLGGLFATIPVYRVSFDFRVMGGLAVCYLPEVAFNAYSTSAVASNDFMWDTYSSVSTAFAWDAGADVRYNFRRVCLMAGIDFLNTNPMLSTTQQYTDQFGRVSYSHVSGMVPESMMNLDIGIGYRLW